MALELHSEIYNEQCLLLTQWRKLLQLTNYHFKGSPAGKKFTHINLVNGEPSFFMNLVNNTPGRDSFMEISSQEAAAIIPQIRIFNVAFENGAPIEGGEKEFLFDTKLSKEDIEGITRQTHGRPSAVGLKKLEIEDLSTQPAETGNYFKIKLHLHFQTIEDLTNPNESGIAFSELINARARGAAKPEGPPSAAASSPENGAEKKGCKMELHPSVQWGSDYSRLRLVVGYAVPPSERAIFGNTELMEALGNMQKSYYLGFVAHEFTFNQDGTVGLAIEYIAEGAAATSTRDADILKFTSTDEASREDTLAEITDTQLLLGQIQARWDALPAGVRQILAPNTGEIVERSVSDREFGEMEIEGAQLGDAEVLRIDPATGETLWETPEQEQRETLRRARALQQDLRMEEATANGRLSVLKERKFGDNALRYNSVLTTFLNKPNIDIWNFSIAASELSENDPNKTIAGVGLATLKNVATLASDIRKKQVITRRETVRDNDTAITSQITDYVNGAKGAKKFEDILENLNNRLTPGESKKDVAIQFTFLGDILDAVGEVLYGRAEKRGGTKTNLLVGPAVFRDIKHGGEPMIVNLAWIPISVKAFSNFWLSAVVKNKETSYTLDRFLKDIINMLVIDVLRNSCGEEKKREDKEVDVCKGKEVAPRVHPAMAYISTSRDAEGNKKLNPGFQLDAKDLAKALAPAHKTADKLDNYVLIYALNEDIKWGPETAGDIESFNKSRGIFHLFIGRDRGIVKNMSFSRLDDPNLRASNIIKQTDEKSLIPIREPYNVTIEMMGNTLFIPGQKVFVTPSIVGLGKGTNSLAAQLGLGGYYMIIKVGSTIESGEYTTEMEGIWQSPSTMEKTAPSPKWVMGRSDRTNSEPPMGTFVSERDAAVKAWQDAVAGGEMPEGPIPDGYVPTSDEAYAHSRVQNQRLEAGEISQEEYERDMHTFTPEQRAANRRERAERRGRPTAHAELLTSRRFREQYE